MKNFILLFLLVLLSSCTATKVAYDYDKKNDFTKYKTYNLYPDIETGFNQLNDKRLFFQIDSVMQVRGLKKSDTPDLHINIVSKEYQNTNSGTVGIGIGGTGRNVGVGVSGGVPVGAPRTYKQIVFDIIDVKRNELVWQAISDSPYNKDASPDQKDRFFFKLIEKVFKKFPLQ